jgi:hypothetical protein
MIAWAISNRSNATRRDDIYPFATRLRSGFPAASPFIDVNLGRKLIYIGGGVHEIER